jgi:hypothetical protein
MLEIRGRNRNQRRDAAETGGVMGTTEATVMANTVTSRPRRRIPRPQSSAARRGGYAVSILVNLVFLYLLNVWPTWRILDFVTSDAINVIPWMNASIIVAIVANLVTFVIDQAWLKSLCDIATTSVGLAATLQLWAVFPFQFADSSVPWELVVRTVLVVAIVGSAIAIVVQLVTFVRALIRTDQGGIPWTWGNPFRPCSASTPISADAQADRSSGGSFSSAHSSAAPSAG